MASSIASFLIMVALTIIVGLAFALRMLFGPAKGGLKALRGQRALRPRRTGRNLPPKFDTKNYRDPKP